MIVCLDPGHGGRDSGATYKDLVEKTLNTLLAAEIATILSPKHGVYITRIGVDAYMRNGGRVRYANSINADVFISVHHNASSSHKGNGFEVLHYPYSRNGIKLASALVRKVCGSWNIKCRGIKPGYYRGDKSRGILSVLSKTKMPAILLEAFFVDGSEDYKRYNHSYSLYRLRYYKLIAYSILEVLDEVHIT